MAIGSVDDMRVLFGGGIIPHEDVQSLLDLGVAALFTPGTTTRAVTDWVHANVTRTSA
ncbi:hypothetical protein ACQPXT_00145 (plasmid) [Streptomyces sp. CA-100214]